LVGLLWVQSASVADGFGSRVPILLFEMAPEPKLSSGFREMIADF
jgi:hypothetical protein